MEYVVYIDVFFLTDFFLNLQSLLLTAVILKKEARLTRLFLAALIGSLWSCVLVIWPMRSVGLELLVTVVIIGSLMTAAAFGSLRISEEKNTVGESGKEYWSKFVRQMLLGSKKILLEDLALYTAAALLSGSLTLFQEKFFLTDWESLIAAGLLTAAFGVFWQQVLQRTDIGNQRYPVRLYYQGKSRGFTALADSGNRLRVPGTERAVSLISYQDCIGFCDRISGGFYIPYRAVGTDHGLLFAITFEKMEIEKNGMCITIENPAVAIVRESLSSNGDFNMLLPEEYVSRF